MSSGEVLHRDAGRVLLIDGRDRVLLFLGHDPAAPETGSYWYPPGGGCEPGESRREAAVRELREETGVIATPGSLGDVVYRREARFRFNGAVYVQRESYYLLRRPGAQVHTGGLRGVEADAILAHRWWSRHELHTTSATVYPRQLAALVA